MSSISGIPTTSPTPQFNPVKSPATPTQPALQPVQAVAKDADGDQDGNTVGKINTHA